MSRFKTIVVFSVLATAFASSVHPSDASAGPSYDFLIQGGTVIDGTGQPGFRADLLIGGDRIIHVGEVDAETIKVRQILDARGKVVTPGFVDAHAHGDPLETPLFENSLAMGVTTICLGQDGWSPTGDTREWMAKVDAAPLGPNIVLLAGHAAARHEAGLEVDEKPTPEKLAKAVRWIEESMAAGSFGLSLGLEYAPGTHSSLDELVALAQPVARHRGVVMAHLRSEDDDMIHRSVDELVAIGEKTGGAMHVAHMKVVLGHGAARGEALLAHLEKARKRGLTLTADLYPYNASATSIRLLFPSWANSPHDYRRVVRERREELAVHLRRRVTTRNGPAATLLITPPWEGKTLEQIAQELEKPFTDVLIDDLGGDGVSAAYFVMDGELQDRLLRDPHVAISSDGGPGAGHPRAYGAFARVIRHHVREHELISLAEAVRKMTGLPSEILGLIEHKRGLLRPGFAADVLVFDPARVKDRSTYASPRELAVGFDEILVGGQRVRREGKWTEARGGKVLRKTASLKTASLKTASLKTASLKTVSLTTSAQ